MNDITRYILNYSDCKDPSLLTKFIYELIPMIKTEQDLNMVRNTLMSNELINMNIRLCCFTPIESIPALRFIGLSRAMSYLISDINAYSVIKPKTFKLEDMFYAEDMGAMRVAILPYIMSILSENMPMADKFEDLKVYIWNRLLTIATWLKESTDILPAMITYDEVIAILLDACYCNGIGNDDNGERLFYDMFIGTYSVLGFTRNDLPDIGAIYGRILTDLTNIGCDVMNKMDSIWSSFPHRLIIYMNLKHMMFRHMTHNDNFK